MNSVPKFDTCSFFYYQQLDYVQVQINSMVHDKYLQGPIFLHEFFAVVFIHIV